MVLNLSYLLEYSQSPTPNDGVGDFLYAGLSFYYLFLKMTSSGFSPFSS